MSVVVVATIVPKPGELETVKAAFLDVIPLVHAEEGCELYALHETGDRLMMIEQWSSRETLAAHSRGSALAALRPLTEGRTEGAADVVVLDAVPTGDPTKGRLLP